eukprot:TRINITY_DN706_c0_g1_i5.p1 TRINITY_DN706_c0_g1~~TRINITY_DN706_c0_g1_i5.p1  ORF type:complete len:404 (+),score=85.11 TRINITY_DN706_c0_g1_i5:46-1212(+)
MAYLPEEDSRTKHPREDENGGVPRPSKVVVRSECSETKGNTLGWAAFGPNEPLKPFSFDRRDVGPTDVEFRVTHCGICHSDIHTVKSEWGKTIFPVVPGHEFVGVVTKIGEKVTKVGVGDRVGQGCMARTCQDCYCCKDNSEQYCSKTVFTYNSLDYDGHITYGGYSNRAVLDEKYVLIIPDGIPSPVAAPLLCAGITVYSPLVFFGANTAGKRLGVVGLGGLGHMAVKFGKAFGLEVVVLSQSAHKEQEALSGLGADEFWLTSDGEKMKTKLQTLDFILDTVSATHDVNALIKLLRVNGKYIIVGLPENPAPVDYSWPIVTHRRMITGSHIGSIKETQEMLEFCAEKQVFPLIERISIDYVNTAYERVLKSQVRYRFVIDCESSFKE